MSSKFYLIIFALLVISCNDNDDTGPEAPEGIIQTASEQGMQETYAQFLALLQGQETTSVIAEVDYQQRASLEEIGTFPMKIVFFANPDMGTPLMQQNQLAGLDLPLRMLFFERNGESYVLYNSPEYLESRYGIEDAPTLQSMSLALQDMVKVVTNNDPEQAEEPEFTVGEGIISVESEQPFDETHIAIRRALIENPDLTLVAEVNHQENAANAGMELRPTRMFVVSNPYLEAELLEDQFTAGVDLPYNILVWEDENQTVRISYNSTGFLQERHGLADDIELAEIADTFEDIAVVAATDTTRYRTPDIIEEN